MTHLVVRATSSSNRQKQSSSSSAVPELSAHRALHVIRICEYHNNMCAMQMGPQSSWQGMQTLWQQWRLIRLAPP